MSKQYIEIDSTYRNRNGFKQPSEFEIDFNTPMTEPHLAFDPVSDEAPIKEWKNNNDMRNYLSTKNNVVINNVNTDNLVIDISFADNSTQALSKEDNYYNNITVVHGTEIRRIVKYEYLETSLPNIFARITVDVPFSTTPSGNLTFNEPNIANSNRMFIPNGSSHDNTYVGYYLYKDTNIPQLYYKIIDYDSNTHHVKLDRNITVFTGSYSIRKLFPSYRLSLVTLGTTQVNGLIPSNLLGNIKIDKNIKFIRVVSNPSYGKYYKITSIKDNGDITFDFIGDDTSNSRNIIYSSVVANMNDIEFLSVTYDNNYSLQFTGSIVSQTQLVCHHIQLLHIILPNKTIKHHRGGRVCRHPYVYVELSNISAGQNRNNIYSNNPHARKALFKCSIKDTTNPNQSPYVKLEGDGMIQTIKFKPTDRLYFRVILSDGSLFEVEEQETYSPLPPNPNIQINAMFSISRQV